MAFAFVVIRAGSPGERCPGRTGPRTTGCAAPGCAQLAACWSQAAGGCSPAQSSREPSYGEMGLRRAAWEGPGSAPRGLLELAIGPRVSAPPAYAPRALARRGRGSSAGSARGFPLGDRGGLGRRAQRAPAGGPGRLAGSRASDAAPCLVWGGAARGDAAFRCGDVNFSTALSPFPPQSPLFAFPRAAGDGAAHGRRGRERGAGRRGCAGRALGGQGRRAHQLCALIPPFPPLLASGPSLPARPVFPPLPRGARACCVPYQAPRFRAGGRRLAGAAVRV